MSCSETVKANIRLLSEDDKLKVDPIKKLLKEMYAVPDREKITNCLDQLTTLQQSSDESLRDYITRAFMLFQKLSEYQTELNLLTISEGQMAVDYVRKGIRNKLHKELLVINTDLKWKYFMTSITRLYQSESNTATSASVNITNIPYDNRRDFQHEDTSQLPSNDTKRPFYCSYHKFNSTHDSKNCRILNSKPPSRPPSMTNHKSKFSRPRQVTQAPTTNKHAGHQGQRNSNESNKHRSKHALQTSMDRDDESLPSMDQDDDSLPHTEDEFALMTSLLVDEQSNKDIINNQSASVVDNLAEDTQKHLHHHPTPSKQANLPVNNGKSLRKYQINLHNIIQRISRVFRRSSTLQADPWI